MNWLKIKPEEVFIRKKTIQRKIPIPLDITPSELVLKIRKKGINDREREIDKYMRDLEKLNMELVNFNYSLNRVKSLTELASIREKILTESCKF